MGWAGLLDFFEQARRGARVRDAECLRQHHLIKIPAPHALADLLDLRHVLFGRMVGGDGASFTRFGRGTWSAVRAMACVEMPPREKSYWKRSICSFCDP